ncbi:hypothetical protein ATANTOWER_027689 [Ataeniobius toweri]|uniref:Uncharacterized protein n=1 Tax=Ataeniobius toweri TaxID=208326 RepID=A0ABU7AZY2_9TELE|nr:hypothetical protein [Ataeniobius toweri]
MSACGTDCMAPPLLSACSRAAVATMWRTTCVDVNVSPTETDDEISTLSNEPEVEYTEVVHSHSADPSRSPLRKGTDTVYSELQNSPHGEFTFMKPKKTCLKP